MTRLWGLVGVCAIGILIFFFYSRINPVEADPFQGFVTWSPDRATLQRAVESVPKGASSEADASARRNEFAKLMTSRFRNHNEGMAMRVRFHDDSTIDLLCPARMEPWNMDRMAMAVWREAKADLGRRYDIKLFRTFIGTPPILVGRLHNLQGPPEKVEIVYLGMTVAPKNGTRGGAGGPQSGEQSVVGR
jgi:hypothetical protein